MNLLELLKQFKNIEPDPAFKEQSKRAVLATTPSAPVAHGWSAQRSIWKIIETGVAVALTGFFILLITGSFSGSGFSPVQYSAIDPQGLHAEAQAIDMQIQLANLDYTEPAVVQSTMQIAGAKPTGAPAAVSTPLVAATGTAPVATSTAATNATGTVSIDQALQSLAQ